MARNGCSGHHSGDSPGSSPLPRGRWFTTEHRRLNHVTRGTPLRARDAPGRPATAERAWAAERDARPTLRKFAQCRGRGASRCRAQGQTEPAGGIVRGRGRGRHRAELVRRSVWVGRPVPGGVDRAVWAPVAARGGGPGAAGRADPGRGGLGQCVAKGALSGPGGYSLKPREAHTWRALRRHGADGAGSTARWPGRWAGDRPRRAPGKGPRPA